MFRETVVQKAFFFRDFASFSLSLRFSLKTPENLRIHRKHAAVHFFRFRRPFLHNAFSAPSAHPHQNCRWSLHLSVFRPGGVGSSTRGGGGRKVRALSRKFVFLGFRREEPGMSREFCRDVPDRCGCSKSLCCDPGRHLQECF